MEEILIGIAITLGGAAIIWLIRISFKQFRIRTKTQEQVCDIVKELKAVQAKVEKHEVQCGSIEFMKESINDIKDAMQVLVPCLYAVMVHAETGKINGEFSRARDEMRKYVFQKKEFEVKGETANGNAK